MLSISDVSIYSDSQISYPLLSPFNSDVSYPEDPFEGTLEVDSRNRVYSAVRQSLYLLGLDKENFDTSSWNPLKNLINSGETVLVKPNAVMHLNMNPSDSVFASITHGSVIRAVIDYIYIALAGKGRVIIADAPLAHSDFEQWLNTTGIHKIIELYREKKNFEIDIFDLRNLYVPWDFEHNYAPSKGRNIEIRDPNGYQEVDLYDASEFSNFSQEDINRLYGSDYKRQKTVVHHSNGHHKYYVSKTVLKADVFISVPKLKVHSKVGITANLKGMVGTQGDKNYIPHHRVGSPNVGGDEHPDLGFAQNTLNRYRMWLLTNILSHENKTADFLYKRLVLIQKLGQKIIDKLGRIRHGEKYKGNIVGGSWYGNDTSWRMTLDLTKIVLFADEEGNLCNHPQRKFFSVIDGIVGGEGEGPLAPTSKHSGVVLAGFNPLSVDIVAARLMGFDYRKIKMLEQGLKRPWLQLWEGEANQIAVFSNKPEYSSLMNNTQARFLDFTPPVGWQDHIEVG
ncbi:hypothetical protein GFS31_27650 [Leptolyngbya sp. BL0902]|uniref:DUF362 domain-containing protein n=1 Tax=Leptolyngbya sp. BL0902 TaxID=1115757 RepID=UPI0018E83A07|nr:DUF362 domain-containing protein [Leptolyngbya sp. BL0902]QQE66069.1 hypothetical protein GFS31_27650 [Leptolyngbya sp. BL0902]